MGTKSKPFATGKPLMGYEEIVVQEDDSKCCSCTPSWVKTFLIFFTAIILLIALALIALGVFLLVIRLPFVPVLLGEVAYLSHFLMFVVGGLLVIVCIIGFVGVSNGKSTLLLTFAWMLFFILLVQFTTGVLALCFSNVLTEWLADRLMFTMQTQYLHETDGVDAAVDQIQQNSSVADQGLIETGLIVFFKTIQKKKKASHMQGIHWLFLIPAALERLKVAESYHIRQMCTTKAAWNQYSLIYENNTL
ncbi:unnamed protein product [Heterobilharzia americana]|nr:unnamed protein product [Heterobilharzia americana]